MEGGKDVEVVRKVKRVNGHFGPGLCDTKWAVKMGYKLGNPMVTMLHVVASSVKD